jgi:ferredoxin
LLAVSGSRLPVAGAVEILAGPEIDLPSDILPVTSQTPDGAFPFMFVITDKCVGCSACELVCPVDAISGVKKEYYFIDPKICIDCGACGRACPYDAILDSFGTWPRRSAAPSGPSRS